MDHSSWLLLLYSLPTRNSAERVSLWRKLKKYGAIQLKTSAYILPHAPTHYERFQWLAKQVRDDGGEANVMVVTKIEGLSNDQIVALFDEARRKDYETIAAQLNEFIAANRKVRSSSFGAALEKIRQRFLQVQEVDYFSCPTAQDVEMLLRRAETRSHGKPTENKPELDIRNFNRRTWLTRPRPEIDRVGSAWLIQRFIDPHARFVFAPKATAFPEAIPYDMSDVEFTHQGDDCTFETLTKRFALRDRVLKQIGEMVHEADLEDGRFQRMECLGLDRVFKGLARLGVDDSAILQKGFECFDALYASLTQRRSGGYLVNDALVV